MHAIDAAQITREGSRVTLRRLPMPRYPAAVMVQSATTLARVPASVDRSPPLYVPRDRRDDITLDRRERLTPSRTSADTNVMSAEATYWITEYVLVTLKLKIMPTSNVI